MQNETMAVNSNPHKNRVHRILAHSYAVNFILFLVGVGLDIISGVKIFSGSFLVPIGIIFMILGSLLVIWAQAKTRALPKEGISVETFSVGPYKYSRHPTHWGLLLLLFGFGVMINATFIIITTAVSFLMSKFAFLNKQEAVLAEKYGAPYIEYKKSVKL